MRDDEAPEGLTGREYVEWVREHQKEKEKSSPRGSRSQNIKMNGKPVPDNRAIPANQQKQRDLRAQKMKEQKAEQEKFENKHPTTNRVVQGFKKAWNAAGVGRDRYVSAREESHRRLERASREENERYSDSWVSVSPWDVSSLPRKKSKKKPSSRSGSSNDYYGISLTNTLTGASYGGGLGGGFLGSTLPKKSTNPTRKKKKKTIRRRRY